MKYLVAALAFVSFSAHADEWNGVDKKMHFAGGALIAAAVGAATDSHTGALAGVAVGFAKEAYDMRNRDRHTPSSKDFVVTAAGAVLGAYAPGIILTRRSISYQWSF